MAEISERNLRDLKFIQFVLKLKVLFSLVCKCQMIENHDRLTIIVRKKTLYCKLGYFQEGFIAKFHENKTLEK